VPLRSCHLANCAHLVMRECYRLSVTPSLWTVFPLIGKDRGTVSLEANVPIARWKAEIIIYEHKLFCVRLIVYVGDISEIVEVIFKGRVIPGSQNWADWTRISGQTFYKNEGDLVFYHQPTRSTKSQWNEEIMTFSHESFNNVSLHAEI
jgi:hypothetical protein